MTVDLPQALGHIHELMSNSDPIIRLMGARKLITLFEDFSLGLLGNRSVDLLDQFEGIFPVNILTELNIPFFPAAIRGDDLDRWDPDFDGHAQAAIDAISASKPLQFSSKCFEIVAMYCFHPNVEIREQAVGIFWFRLRQLLIDGASYSEFEVYMGFIRSRLDSSNPSHQSISRDIAGTMQILTDYLVGYVDYSLGVLLQSDPGLWEARLHFLSKYVLKKGVLSELKVTYINAVEDWVDQLRKLQSSTDIDLLRSKIGNLMAKLQPVIDST